MKEEYQPFAEIAAKKNVSITFPQDQPDEIHLDMDMVEQSIRCAIERCSHEGIKEKLGRLLATGTDAQKVAFVFGEGEYFFPEDIEAMAKIARRAGGSTLNQKESVCKKVCEWYAYLVCKCLRDGSQECQEKQRKICEAKSCDG